LSSACMRSTKTCRQAGLPSWSHTEPISTITHQSLRTELNSRKLATCKTRLRGWCVVRGAWCVVRGVWGVGRGAWRVVRGAWCVVRGAWRVVRGAWCVGGWASDSDYLRAFGLVGVRKVIHGDPQFGRGCATPTQVQPEHAFRRRKQADKTWNDYAFSVQYDPCIIICVCSPRVYTARVYTTRALQHMQISHLPSGGGGGGRGGGLDPKY
jgi:hypothetical protein